MVAHCVAALLYLGVIHGELAHDPMVRDALWKLLADAHYGYSAREEAMFIIRGADGQLSFLRWERTGIPHHAHWNAPLPAGTVAIVHTHPNTMPRPSRMDEQTAVRNNLPVYVVTRTKIMKTSHGQTDVVLKGEWWERG
ncbi:MAG TPA: Mov34/MPN/PAD-1 family protein [Thermoanaerobaculia bacterium]